MGAEAQALPGGGSVQLPSPWNGKPSYPTYADRAGSDVLIGYRNWRSTMSGHPECDGMLGVGRSEKFPGLENFVRTCRAALSIQWSDADRMPGQAWDGNEKRWQLETQTGPNGPELVQQLAVHRVGFFGVYDEASHLYAVQYVSGVSVAMWLYDKHGGVDGAR